jgi:cyclophilin family peptidyl-prolyl cis-trans isomerase
VFQGLTASGFYNSNTIFHRVVAGFVNQGGDPNTNGLGGLVFKYDDEFHPQAMFSGNGQLALANSGPDTDGSQFFVTVGPQRFLDFKYTLFGQLLRGFNVLTNINNTAVDTNSRPLANVIITQASLVPDLTDMALTLVATNVAGATNTIKVIADDGVGGRATNTFTATILADTNSNWQPFQYGGGVTNLVGPANVPLTNTLAALELDGQTLYWSVYYANLASQTNSSVSGFYFNNLLQTLAYNVTNAQGQLQLIITPATNYSGPVSFYFEVSSNQFWSTIHDNYPFYGAIPPYDQQVYTFVFGDTPIVAQPATIVPQLPGAFTNLLLATFTNGVTGSAVTNFTAAINWGDNSITAGVITTNTAKLKQVFGAHTYTNSGDYPVYVTIQSTLGVTTTVSNTLTVMPPLKLKRTGTNNVISWPAWAYAYQVLANTNLASTNWVAVTNLAGLAGFQNVVSNSGTASKGFFRLKK